MISLKEASRAINNHRSFRISKNDFENYKEYLNCLFSYAGIEHCSAYTVCRLPYNEGKTKKLCRNGWEHFKSKNDLDGYVKYLCCLWRPASESQVIHSDVFFQLAHEIAQEYGFESKRFILKIITQAQRFLFDINDKKRYKSILDFYPFTNDSIKELMDWLSGDEFDIIWGKDGIIKTEMTDLISNRFAGEIVGGLHPEKYDLEKMLLKQWILNSKESLNAAFGSRFTESLFGQLDTIFERTKLVFTYYYSCFGTRLSLGESIQRHSPLPDRLLGELLGNILYNGPSLKNEDDMQISSLPASILRTKVTKSSITWNSASFTLTRNTITINTSINEKPCKYEMPCQYITGKFVKYIDKSPAFWEAICAHLPDIHCAVNRFGIVEVLNKNLLDSCFQSLAQALFGNATFSIGGEEIDTDVCSYLLSLKSRCYNYLLRNRVKEYPVKLIKEKYVVSSGACVEENAAVIVIRENPRYLHVVYENESLARSSYAFVITKESYNQLLRELKNYFSSSEANKRQRLMNSQSIFTKNDWILSVKRVAHKDMDAWERDILLHYLL